MSEKQKTVNRLWFEVKNMDGYDLEYEWMEKGGRDTKYLERADVLKLIDSLLSKEAKAEKKHV
ncbi:MAG: hypothetical protein ABIJ57_12500 [Pseudomonadota bacterium]|uniref:Uncharacterized protein n=1 Tax=viral metagenome TaxID=1070528 RepID=A0A6M3LJF0_9ZZZZ